MPKIFSLLLLLALCCATPAFAAPAADASADSAAATAPSVRPNRIEQLTGKTWMASSQDAKLGVLFGLELAMNVDKAIADFFAREAAAKSVQGSSKKAARGQHEELRFKLSPFALAWYEAFKDVTLKDIAARIDAWYAANPDQSDRLVLNVVWVELMKKPLPKVSAR